MKHEARMAELADAHGLGPCAARRAGSTPVPGTICLGLSCLQKLIAYSLPTAPEQLTSTSLIYNEQSLNTPDLGSGGETHGGSSPPFRTMLRDLSTAPGISAAGSPPEILRCAQDERARLKRRACTVT